MKSLSKWIRRNQRCALKTAICDFERFSLLVVSRARVTTDEERVS